MRKQKKDFHFLMLRNRKLFLLVIQKLPIIISFGYIKNIFEIMTTYFYFLKIEFFFNFERLDNAMQCEVIS